ncbi:PolC-type DNA polymerase III [Heliorestis convoluta]|uniref:DNA polymerase III PolC-type n=1 Tax=Heliorestis convoluta TaxID=356322 RepID=A0A5Q2MZ15_9FIRM|nr:PolC-type DNA polymerase III [Heliorestis convoluta]QGG48214.1 PolC-type DNA polymerase III [Heliorestis convoluta]
MSQPSNVIINNQRYDNKVFRIQQFLINQRGQEALLYLQATGPWQEEDLLQWKEKVAAILPECNCLHLTIQCKIATIEELLQEYWSCWIHLATPDQPLLRSTLQALKGTVEGNRIIFKVERTKIDLLKSRQCVHSLVQQAEQVFGLSINISLEEVENLCDDSYLQNREEEERRLFLEACKSQSADEKVKESKDKEENKKSNQNQEIYGKKIDTSMVTPIKDIEDEERSVVIAGRIFGLETREMKSGRRLITFHITDLSDAITVKVFEGEKEDLLESGELKEHRWVKVRGSVQFDKYQQELALLARDINKAEEPVSRFDNAPIKRVELHAHTKMSSMDAVLSAKDLIARAAAWGHKAIAITDHGVVQAFPEAADAGKKHNIKVIYGVEAYLVDKAPATGEKVKSYHIILLVRNKTGLKNLYQLITKSHLQYFHRRPRIPRDLLEEYRDGLLLGSACEAGELYQALLQKASPEKIEEIVNFYDYLEIQPIGNNRFLLRKGHVQSENELQSINEHIVGLGQKAGKLVVATCDVHFLEPIDEYYRRILMAGKGFDDADDQAPLYFRTTEEMLEEFSYLGKDRAHEVVVANPGQIADQIEMLQPIPDDFFPPIIEGAEEQIRQMTEDCAATLYGNPLPDIVQKRVDKELNSIISNGFAVLYLISQKLVKKSNDDGYLVGSRGSVGSSLVATFTGITEVNPLPPHYRCSACKFSEFFTDGTIGCGADLPDRNCPTCGKELEKDGHDIPFETFLGFEGDKVPDIDLNFSGEYQPRAHKFTEELFGRDYVFRAGTISTLAERTAFGFVKNYLDEKKMHCRNAEIARLVGGCTGVKRTTGQHPGGLMVVPKNADIHDFTPLQRPADDVKSETITTHFDYHSISSRLVKLDILGHDDPTVIKMLEDLTGVDARKIPLDEPKTMSLFSTTEALGVTAEQIRSNVGTYGIPEFGTKFVRQMLEDTRPKSFSELVRISGFSHGTDVWLNNAQDLIKSGTCQVNEAISTRDDIMVYLIYQGLPPKKAFSIMESVRKGKGLKPEDEELMRHHQVPSWYIESCKKIKYMFPKAHAVAYVTMAFRIAYFKVYYPEAFYASFFTVRADEFDGDIICNGVHPVRMKIEEIEKKGHDATQKEKNLMTILELALEMYERGIAMQKVTLLRSHSTRFLIEREGLLPPFAALAGLGEAAAQNIMTAREEVPFTSIEDIRIRARVSKTVIEVLQNHGALEGLSETNQICLF